jgi:hypothetical protein
MATPSFARQLATLVAETTNQYGVRSSRRTDSVHAFIRSYIEARNPRVRCVVEHALPTKLGSFDVDLAVFAGDTLVGCLLFKGLTSSISKNEKNYEHNKLGEAIKAKSGMSKTAKLVYLDVVPVRCPTYKSDGSVKCWESHPPEVVRERCVRLCEVANADRLTPIIDDIYTVSVDYAYTPDKKIEVTSVVDETDLTRFEAFVDGLAPVEDTSSLV